MKEGITAPDGKKIGGGYFMKLNPDNFFEKHFSGADILRDTRSVDGTDVVSSFFNDSLGGQGVAAKGPPSDIELQVECTLEELYNGCFKQVEYQRDVVKFDAKTLNKQRCVQQIEIKPGFSADTVVTYKGQGNEQAGHPPADLKIGVTQLDHADYRRVGDDLILTKRITLTQAIEMNPISIVTLDGRKLTVTADEQISPQTCKLIQNEGMPVTQT